MPLVSRFANQGQFYKEPTEPPNTLDGDLWSDTTANLLKLNVAGTFQDVGVSSFSSSATVSYSETIGDYNQPDAAVSTSDAPGPGVLDEDFSACTTNQCDGLWPSSDTAKILVDTTNNEIDFTCRANTTDKDTMSYDLGAGNISDSKWLWRTTVTVAANGTDAALLMCASSSSNILSSANADRAGLMLYYGATNIDFRGSGGSDGAIWTGGAAQDSGQAKQNTTFYIEIKRTSTTALTCTWFSDSTYDTTVFTHTFTIAAGISGLRYLTFQNFNSGGNEPTDLIGTISHTEFWNGVTTPGTSPDNAVDDDTATYWESTQETNPAIYVDEGESNNFVGVALYPHADTTETEIQIRVSSDATFTAAEATRTITVSNLTNGEWNYIRFNVAGGRYLEIYGNSGNSSVLAFNEIKCLTKTDAEIIADLGILTISPTDTALALDGT